MTISICEEKRRIKDKEAEVTISCHGMWIYQQFSSQYPEEL